MGAEGRPHEQDIGWIPADGPLGWLDDFGEAGREAAALVQARLQDRTRVQYRAAFAKYVRFIRLSHRGRWWRDYPPQVAMCTASLVLFVGHLHRAHIFGRTMNQSLSALARFANLGLGRVPGKVPGDPLGRWHVLIRSAIKGARQTDPPITRKVMVTPQMVAALLVAGVPDLGEATAVDDICCFVALLLMSAGMLRPQDVTSPTQAMPGPLYTRGARVGGAEAPPGQAASLLIRSSKGDPTGRGTRKMFFRQPESLACPAHWLETWLGVIAGRPWRTPEDAPLFQLSSGRFLTAAHLAQALRRGLARAEATGRTVPSITGVPSLHGLRVGSCTAAWEAGVAEGLIRIEMRWRSAGFVPAYVNSNDFRAAQDAINAARGGVA